MAIDEADRPLAVFDIDGVLADVRHRLHFIAHRPKNWKGFFAAAADDPLLADGYDLAHQMAADHTVVYLTGRPRSNRTLTAAWLKQHALPHGTLIMRPDRDYRPARMFKAEQLLELSAAHEIGLVIDDDPEVVKAFDEAGVPVRLATWLPYAKAMSTAQEREGRT